MVLVFNTHTFEVIHIYPEGSDIVLSKRKFREKIKFGCSNVSWSQVITNNCPYIMDSRNTEICLVDIDQFKQMSPILPILYEERIREFIRHLEREKIIESIFG